MMSMRNFIIYVLQNIVKFDAKWEKNENGQVKVHALVSNKGEQKCCNKSQLRREIE